MQNFKSILFIVMFTSLLNKTQNFRIIWKIEADFSCFYCSLYVALFCYLVE